MNVLRAMTDRLSAGKASNEPRSSSKLFDTKTGSLDNFLNPVNVTTLDVEVIHHASFNWEMQQKNMNLSTYPR